MSVTLYTGTPGSGKSFHTISNILEFLNMGKKVVANFPINFDVVKNVKKRDKYKKNFTYVSNSRINVGFLVDFSKKYMVSKRENQFLLVLDEAQLLFNSRDFAKKDRMEWISFFSQHRKLGFTCILVAQYDRMLDRQIRAIVEYEALHRKLNNYAWFWIIPVPVFSVTRFWYSAKQKTGAVDFVLYRRSLARFYDTFSVFGDDTEAGAGGPIVSPASGASPML